MLKKIYNTINSSELYKRIANGAFWSVLGSAIAKILVLVAGIICANILGKKGYGELGLIRSTINMFVIFGTAGMGVTATKYISQYRHSDKNEVARIYSITTLFTTISALLIALLVIIFSSKLATHALNAPHLGDSIKFAALLLFVTIINSSYQGTLSGYENFKRISINTFISSFVEASLVVIGAVLAGVDGALLGYGIGISTMMILNRFYVKKTLIQDEIHIQYKKLKLSDFNVLTKFSIPAALSSFLVVPSYWIVRTLMVRYSGFEELGIYEAADQWRVIILFIPSALSNIVLPILSSYIGNNEADTYKRALKINVILNVGISLVLAIAVSVLSKWISQSYGEGFDNTYVLVFLAFSTVFSAFASVVGLSIVSQGKTCIGFAFNVIWALMFVCFSVFTLRYGYGATGVAFSLMCAYMLHGIFQFIYLKLTVLK